ncbi:MAG: bacterial Ig-like domain-containing protein [Christensenellales bacterium]
MRKITRILLATILAVSLLLGAVSCGENDSVRSIEIAQNPTQTYYSVGDALNLAGGKIKVTFSDGKTAEIALDDESVTVEADTSTVGEKTVRVSYVVNGKTYNTSFVVTVEDETSAEVRLLSEIVKGFVAEMKTNDSFDIDFAVGTQYFDLAVKGTLVISDNAISEFQLKVTLDRYEEYAGEAEYSTDVDNDVPITSYLFENPAVSGFVLECVLKDGTLFGRTGKYYYALKDADQFDETDIEYGSWDAKSFDVRTEETIAGIISMVRENLAVPASSGVFGQILEYIAMITNVEYDGVNGRYTVGVEVDVAEQIEVLAKGLKEFYDTYKDKGIVEVIDAILAANGNDKTLKDYIDTVVRLNVGEFKIGALIDLVDMVLAEDGLSVEAILDKAMLVPGIGELLAGIPTAEGQSVYDAILENYGKMTLNEVLGAAFVGESAKTDIYDLWINAKYVPYEMTFVESEAKWVCEELGLAGTTEELQAEWEDKYTFKPLYDDETELMTGIVVYPTPYPATLCVNASPDDDGNYLYSVGESLSGLTAAEYAEWKADFDKNNEGKWVNTDNSVGFDLNLPILQFYYMLNDKYEYNITLDSLVGFIKAETGIDIPSVLGFVASLDMEKLGGNVSVVFDEKGNLSAVDAGLEAKISMASGTDDAESAPIVDEYIEISLAIGNYNAATVDVPVDGIECAPYLQSAEIDYGAETYVIGVGKYSSDREIEDLEVAVYFGDGSDYDRVCVSAENLQYVFNPETAEITLSSETVAAIKDIVGESDCYNLEISCLFTKMLDEDTKLSSYAEAYCYFAGVVEARGEINVNLPIAVR